MKKELMHLSYLGSRDYIDISQISKFFFQSQAFRDLNLNDFSISGFRVRMLGAIKHHCWIEREPPPGVDPVCRVDVERPGRRHSFFLISDPSSPIQGREPEPEPDLISRIREDDSRYWIDRPVDYFWTYVYTQLGRHLMNQQFGAMKPKASGYETSRIPTLARGKSFFISKKTQHRGPFVFMEGGSGDEFFAKIVVRKSADE